ncbi:hypothetical protein HD806DRAFT_481296 [Xylariaceae sp. AK1471]|nr:hypothetical protein HD806DRAFT_481296 [Xylariaceae sp. AK1471]
MSFVYTPSVASDIGSFIDTSDSGGEYQELQNHFQHLWNPLGMQNDGEATDSTHLEAMRDAINDWSHLRLPQSPDEILEQVRDDRSATPSFAGYNDDTPSTPGGLVFGSAEQPDNERICYGMIYQAEVKLSEKNMPKLNSKLQNEVQVSSTGRILNFTVERKVDHLTISFSDGATLGILNDSMFESLGPIMEREPAFFLEGVALTQLLRDRIGKINKSSDRKIRLDINVYGLRGKMRLIGDELSLKKVWLQRPDNYKTAFPYENPHVVSFPGIDHTSASANNVRKTADGEGPLAEGDRIQKIVSEVHGALQRAGELETTTGDRRLQTPLLDHQQRALTFMKQRESGNIPDKYRLWQKSSYDGQEMYIHRVTKTRSIVQPEERGGGILADEMGMGKSLCLLALLLDTLDDARNWAKQRHSEEYHSSTIKNYSRSTLVIVPSALLINNWLKEIKTHLGGTLKWIKYHGVRRERDLDALADSDLIVTTYQTLAFESAAKRSQLHKIGWYRVVLDEAHVIRRPPTTFHKTCLELEARSRWCLTGTPIQNRLLDIGALFSFLRAEPFNSISQFRRFIVVPFEQGDEIVKDRLVLLYDSLCLRRNKGILCLPGIDQLIRELHFSPEERQQYDATSSILNRTIREKVGQYRDDKPNDFGLFQAHLQLRILCNHGTYQKPFSWKRTAHLNEFMAFNCGNDFEKICHGCEQRRPALGSSCTSSMTNNCDHFFCSSCLEDLETIVGPSEPMSCPGCMYKDTAKSLHTGIMPTRNNNRRVYHRDTLGRGAYFKEVGFSTKMNALVQDVKQGLDEMKSIVFSCWTCTMDLVGRHLEKAGIKFLRIDGDTLMSKRQRTLDDFDKDFGARVLLMTTGTGAFGLNITAARRVFILEPQWNPSIENQAIARTTRLNQKEKVLVIRYLIGETVETEMLSQQKQKREIAKIGW